MNLSQFVAEKRSRIFEELGNGTAPSEGSYSESLLREAKGKGRPQMGATRYEPEAIFFEFIYPSPGTTPIVVTIRIDAAERIVFMPVPTWVVESIWQGEIDGSFHFQSEAADLVKDFVGQLEPSANEILFGPKSPTRRG